MLGSKIKTLRIANKWTQAQLSEKLNETFGLKTDRVMISKWENGFQTPVIYTISCLAKLFGVSIDYLNDESNNSDFRFPHPTITTDTVTFPVIGELAAGYESIAVEDWSGETVEIPNAYLKGRKYNDFLVLSVKGDSMYPHFMEGDKVLILRQNCVNRNGDVCAVIYNDELATLKKVIVSGNNDYIDLIPINPEYKPRRISGEEMEHVHIIGIPKLLLREFDV